MFYWIAANLLVLLHFAFVCFVVFGAFLVLKWRWTVYLHIPAAVWGALIEYQGWVCPLRVRKKITLQFIALSFRSDLVEQIELNRKHSLSCVEDSANEDRTKMA